jgi:hypothetical protein
MSASTDPVGKTEQAIAALRALWQVAVKANNLAAEQALDTQINDLSDKLDALRGAKIAADNAQIAALNKQIDAVTAAATAAMQDLSKVSAALDAALAAAKLLDTVVAAAAKL